MDPITALFTRRGEIYFMLFHASVKTTSAGLMGSSTSLQESMYESLFEYGDRQKKIPTHSYRNKKQFWSFTPCFPPNLFFDNASIR